LRQALAAGRLQARDIAPELEGPQCQGSAETQGDGQHHPPQGPRQCTAHCHSGRTDRQAAKKQTGSHGSCSLAGDPMTKAARNRFRAAVVEPLLGPAANSGGLAFAELLAATCAMQTNFFALDFPGIAGHKAGLAELWLERGVVVDQSAGDAMTHCAGLA